MCESESEVGLDTRDTRDVRARLDWWDGMGWEVDLMGWLGVCSCVVGWLGGYLGA